MPLVLRVGQRFQQLLVASGAAAVFGRASAFARQAAGARFPFGQRPHHDELNAMLPAIPEVVVIAERVTSTGE